MPDKQDDELDEIEQRIGDLWGMSHKEQKALGNCLLVFVAIAVVAAILALFVWRQLL